MGYKRNIKTCVVNLLYAKSGNICEMYGCHNQLLHDNNSKISEICHIEAISENGPRYNAELSEEYINSYDNLILLCPTCHSIIDNKSNEPLYTVEYLKNMKKYHEQKVEESLLEKSAIERPIAVEQYNVGKIMEQFELIYEKEIDEIFIYDVLKNVLLMKRAIRSVISNIACQCNEENTKKINTLRFMNRENLDTYQYAEILRYLEIEKIIKEVDYNFLEGYDDEYGNFCSVENNYVLKAKNGTWILQRRGKVIVAMRRLFQNDQQFYDMLVERKLDILKEICD